MANRKWVEDSFRTEIRRKREDLRWSQETLAEKLSARGVPMHWTTIAKIEKGTRSVRIDEAAAIADLFEVSLDVLAGRQAVPGDDPAFALRALRDIAASSMWQIGGLRDALVVRFREALAFDFKGRDLVERQAERAHNGLTEAQDAVTQLTLLFPDPTERTVEQ
jgi:transcriptional regulator with XRE-family HTH domain